MTAFSDDVIAALNAPLAREHVKTREQAGRQVSYIEGWHAIAEANRIFGFDGWSRETVLSECCYAGEYQRPVWKNGRKTDETVTSFRCSYRAKVRIRIGQIVREGSGHGNGFADNPGDAHESAEKEAETDAMKRALMTFGNPFGLALYDKAQSNVEAPMRAAEAPARPARNLDRDATPRRLSETRDAILHAIEIVDSPARLDGILRVHARALEELKAASVPTYDRIMRLAGERRGQLIEAPRENAGSAPMLMGEP